jgi:conjugative transfer signal peptidase TraF
MLLAIGAVAGLLAAADGLWWSGWRVNLTESEPLGFYRLAAIGASTVIRHGTLIEFCPPPSVTPARFPFYMKGNCPGGGMPMFKEVVGVPGDRIDVSLGGVSVNGRPLSHSAQLSRSVTWPRLQLPHQTRMFVLGAEQYWVYGRGAKPALAAQSFDSRYWGAVTRAEIRRVGPAGPGPEETSAMLIPPN